MKLPFSEPYLSGCKRANSAKHIRDLATEMARLRPHAISKSNLEEDDHGAPYPVNFTKGLLHDKCGLVQYSVDYRCFVEAINAPDSSLFEKHVFSDQERDVQFNCDIKHTCHGKENVTWRGWESPRAGHVYELQGADGGSCGMAPAPRTGSSELAAEMAEVYALAILRDVPFSTICEGGREQLCPSSKGDNASQLSADQIVELLNKMPFFCGTQQQSSTPHNSNDAGYNQFELNRRFARTHSTSEKLTTENIFRGSTKGALVGPYISQFMLIGAKSLACAGGGAASFPGLDAAFDPQDGFIPYGSLIIDQRTLSHKNCLDFMTDWSSWLDVQNGANFKGADQFEQRRRFITTPRDLATYVHFDALYQAYLNAALLMLALGVPHSKGFPEVSASGKRDAFATFGGPHILSLVTEVATRCLKAVRRQKFNYHRRARPEAIAGRLALYCMGEEQNPKLLEKFGCSLPAFNKTYKEIPKELRDAIIRHNKKQNHDMAAMRADSLHCPSDPCLPDGIKPEGFDACNLLLPMAFPEGSPMHPAYGAGHATVAGGCVTMLKAFFEMFETCNSFVERELCDKDGKPIAFVPNKDGSKLVQDKKTKGKLTVQGELDKLAANIAIGRNMAGVHYYSDYYDSLRMGERIAVSMLLEQAPTYGEAVQMTFKSFDGDHITLHGEPGSCPSLAIIASDGTAVSPDEWWLRHVTGQELHEDL